MTTMSNIASLTMQIETLRDQQRRLEEEHKRYQSAYTGGMWGILLGILLTPVFGLGLLLIAAGGLAVLTNVTKRKTAQTRIAEIQTQIETLRQQIATASGAL